jgi:uncharacterized membrane protein YhiD involved in acid resistance
MRKTRIIVVTFIASFLIVLAVSVVYFSLSRQVKPQPAIEPETKAEKVSLATTPVKTPEEVQIPFLTQAFPPEESDPNQTWIERSLQIVVRLLLAVILSAILAFRPRRNIPLLQRNLSVAQTQILLAVVAAALMMIVGNNAARAFAIFAAVSLVRFRTNIRDPKEVTVLLISLAIGLAAGVGRWELGLTVCIFVLILLWLLEYKEPEQVFRSMELTIKTKNTDATQNILKKIFSIYGLEAEVRQLSPPDEENAIGCIVYFLNIRLTVSTDRLSEKIFDLDSHNIEGITWKNQKNTTYIYN